MTFAELFILALGLAMDAFAVSLCAGLSLKAASIKAMLIYGAYFGFFQAAMPLIGYLAGRQFAGSIMAFDHWISFVLLAFIGGKMIYESLKKHDEGSEKAVSLSLAAMLPLAVATSIDALAVGVSFAFLSVEIVPAVLTIGIITLVISAAGVGLGRIFGKAYRSRAEMLGGIILVIIGVKILIDHLVAQA